MNRFQRALRLLVGARRWDAKHHPTQVKGDQAAIDAVKKAKAQTDPKPAPKPEPVPSLNHHVKIPGAVQKPIPQTSTDPDIVPVGAVFHVAVSEAESLHDFFSGPSGGVESTGYIRRDGTIEQYRPLTVECDAQFDGNSWIENGRRLGLTSWETQGMGEGEWTDAQIASIKKIIDFHRDQWGVPSRVCPGPTTAGFGYHALFDAWNHNHHSCPGPDRIAQFKRVIVPWLKTGARA